MHPPSPRTSQAGSIGLVLGALLLALALVLAGAPPVLRVVAAADPAQLAAACADGHPFFAAAAQVVDERGRVAPNAPAVLGIQDSANDTPRPLVLATQAQVGAVHGLAFDAGRGLLYAAAYHKRGAPFGPGGPGAIYRIELATGAVQAWAALPAGVDRHTWRDADLAAAAWVGRTSLGDIELSEDGSEVFAANLFDGRIYRLSTADGRVLGSFTNAAADSDWRGSARLFGLAYVDAWLYQGIVDLSGKSLDGDRPVAHLFRTRPDGTEAVALATVLIALSSPGPRDPANQIGPWVGGDPMLADLELRPGGGFVLALRNADLDREIGGEAWSRYIPGMAVVLEPGAAGLAPADPPRFAGLSATGGLALVPGMDVVAATAHISSPVEPVSPPGIPELLPMPFVTWLDGASGRSLAQEPSGLRDLATLGDLETLCRADRTIDPVRIATATAQSATAAAATAQGPATRAIETARAISGTITALVTRYPGTATAMAQTATARAAGTREPGAGPLATIEAACKTDYPYFAVSSFVRERAAGEPGPAGLRGAPAIEAFDSRPSKRIRLAIAGEVGAVYGLAYDWRRGHLYASAYHKRMAAIGPFGPGAIYRLDLDSGDIGLLTVLGAGPAIHDMDTNFDEIAAPWVGRVGLGDIEIADDGSELYAVNLWNRMIYRIAIPSGQLLGVFATGGRSEAWAIQARPMGLGFHDGWLYHGVVNSGELIASDLEALVFRSRPDGSEMSEVARFGLGYRGTFDGSWGRWRVYPTPPGPSGPWSGYHGAMLADIAFRANGDMILGLRDRSSDAELFGAGAGDMLPARRVGDAWYVQTSPEHYEDGSRHHSEGEWGGLAAFAGRDWIVATLLDPDCCSSGGAAWWDNPSGRVQRRENIYTHTTAWLNFAKAQGLGDLESLCPPDVPPTATPTDTPPPTDTPTDTPTATATSTPTTTRTSTPVPTPTTTPTATPTPAPIYLPFLDKRPCSVEAHYADIVLILDLSTSMERPTRSGRIKLEAALEAAGLFVDQLALAPDPDGGHDRVGIVGFNGSAWTALALSNDEVAIRAAIAALPQRLAQGTRLDLALRQAQAALADAGGRGPSVMPVAILLTDGLPNQVPTPAGGGSQEDAVLEAARSLKAGARLFTIGLGLPEEVPGELLRAAASDPADYAFAPDAGDLAAIYRQIAGRIVTCPTDR